jgi:hypothetical protein
MSRNELWRSIAIPAVLGLAGSLLSARPAAASGTLGVVVRAPHATVAFAIGHPAFPVGFVVRPPYASRVFYRPRFGHGFWAPVAPGAIHGIRHAHFVPVRRYRTGWIVAPPRWGAYRSSRW